MHEPVSPLRVLLVEDSPDDARIVVGALRDLGRPLLTEVVCSEATLRESLQRFRPDIILCDFSMPGFTGTQALEIVAELTPTVPFIYVAGTIGEELAIDAMRRGAVDYVPKDNLPRLQPAVKRALFDAAQARKIQQQARIQAVISAHANCVLRAGSAEELLDMTCRVAVEQGHFMAAVIARPTPGNALEVVSSFGDGGVIEMMVAPGPVALDGTDANEQPTTRAFLLQEKIVVPHYPDSDAPAPLRDAMARVGAAAEIALPIGSPPWAVLGLFSSMPQVFDEEIALFEMLTAEIDHARDFIAKSERLEYLAYHNPVTGFPNRTSFTEMIGPHLGRGPNVLVMVDIDRFRYFNQSRGRRFGDQLLAAVGKRLRSLVPADALFTHPGDDAFMFAYPSGESMEAAVARVQSLLAACNEPSFIVEDEEVRVRLHASVLLAPVHADSAEAIERNLVAGLAEAKARDQAVVVFTEEVGLRAPQRVELERELRTALAKGEFELFLQPKFDAFTQRLTGAEALLRWRHPERGLIAPAQFISVLEETGLIIEVGAWVRSEGLSIWRRWNAQGRGDLRLAVNVSARELRHADFVPGCTALLGPCEGHGLDIEITESMLMDDIDKSIQILQSLRTLGCKIAIDDFGTGYSSLNYLSRLPADALKIDQSFTAALVSSADTLSMVTNIIGLAHSLGLAVVAEGVEEEEQATMLRLLRCDELQGYLFGQPMAVGDFENALLSKTFAGVDKGSGSVPANAGSRIDRKRHAVAAVPAVATSISTTPVEPTQPRQDVPRWRSRTKLAGRNVLYAIICVLVVAVLVLGYRSEFAHMTASADSGVLDSIAVLPFTDLSVGKDYQYFAEGLSEELLNRLATIPQLRVIGRASSFSFKGRNLDIASIAKTLNVAIVLEGSVRKSANRLQITAQLIRSADGSRIWSQTYDRQMTDIFQVQDEISRAVVSALKLKLLPGQERALARPQASNPEAYNQYLLGRSFFRQSTMESFKLAQSALEISVALAPDYAPAYAELANTVSYLADYADSADAVSAGQQRARQLADKAIALDPQLADGYRVRASLRSLAFDFSGAMTDTLQALRLNSGDTDNQRNYGLLLVAMGRLDEALLVTSKAAELDPLSANAFVSIGLIYNALGQLPQAEGAFDHALKLMPGHAFAQVNLAQSYLLQGDNAKALTCVQRLGPGLWRTFDMVLVQYSLGHKTEADALLAELIKANGDSAAYQIAEAYAWREQADLAFAWLQRAYDQHDGGLELMKVDPLLRSLHDDPRFAALLKKLGLPL